MRDNRYDPMSLFRPQNIAHYYGDQVRQLFVASAILSVIAIPVLGHLLPFGSLFEIGLAILLVLLAGITHPHSSGVMWANVIASGVGVLLFEMAAVSFYSGDAFFLFIAREVIAVMLLFAFYFSVKTVRAMAEGKVGHEAEPQEFAPERQNDNF